jgi:hypothetical protein
MVLIPALQADADRQVIRLLSTVNDIYCDKYYFTVRLSRFIGKPFVKYGDFMVE